MRLSLKESRTKLLNATNLDRKSGIRGPKKMGEAPPQPFVPDPPIVISTGASMGLRPTQGDEKRLLFSDYWSLEAPPSPLSSRPKWRDLRFLSLDCETNPGNAR